MAEPTPIQTILISSELGTKSDSPQFLKERIEEVRIERMAKVTEWLEYDDVFLSHRGFSSTQRPWWKAPSQDLHGEYGHTLSLGLTRLSSIPYPLLTPHTLQKTFEDRVVSRMVKEIKTTGNQFFQDNIESYYHNGALNCDGKMTSQLQAKCTGCNLNPILGKGMQGEKEKKQEQPFSPGKRKEPVQCVLSLLVVTIVFLWIIHDTYTLSATIVQHQHAPVFNCSSLLEPFGFMVFIWAIAATIVVGAPFSRLLSAMLMFSAMWMLVRSAKSIIQVYVPILGILFTGWYMLVEKQPPN